MKTYQTVHVIDYNELDIDLMNYKNLCIFDLLSEDGIKNDTIYNMYPFEITKYNLSDPNESLYLAAFVNWLTCFKGKNWKDENYWFSDFLSNIGFKIYIDENPEIIILRFLCTFDEIPEGNYFIKMSW